MKSKDDLPPKERAEFERWCSCKRRILEATRKILGSSHPADLVSILMFVIADIADTSNNPRATIALIASQMSELVELADGPRDPAN